MNALCQMTGVSRAGFYRWRMPRQATPVEMKIRDQMQLVTLESPAYGYRRITWELQRRGFKINHKHVLRMMREDTLLCVRRRAFVATTDSRHNLPVYAIRFRWSDGHSTGICTFEHLRELCACPRCVGEVRTAQELATAPQRVAERSPAERAGSGR